jgi:hypothetical protein
MTDTARPGRPGRYRSVSPSKSYLMDWKGHMLFILGQFRRKLFSRVVRQKLFTSHMLDTLDSASKLSLKPSNGIVAGGSWHRPGKEQRTEIQLCRTCCGLPSAVDWFG